jgi:hypothetical protein
LLEHEEVRDAHWLWDVLRVSDVLLGGVVRVEVMGLRVGLFVEVAVIGVVCGHALLEAVDNGAVL